MSIRVRFVVADGGRGDREITRRGPVAVLDARAFGEPGKRPDTVIYGRTAGARSSRR